MGRRGGARQRERAQDVGLLHFQARACPRPSQTLDSGSLEDSRVPTKVAEGRRKLYKVLEALESVGLVKTPEKRTFAFFLLTFPCELGLGPHGG